ncbi:MAG: transaldolase family protein [Chloroflexota bacterium]
MSTGYFHRIAAETETRFWINLPTGQETADAIAAGTVSCTTNPTYGARLLDAESEFINPIIDEVAGAARDVDEATEQVFARSVERLVAAFRPLYRASGGTAGFVTVQGDPRRDEDADFIVAEALRYRRLGENVMAKIPCHEAGLAAIAALVERNVPICATEVFGVDQAVAVSETYAQAAASSGYRPPLFVTHITGILDLYLSRYVEREKVEIAPTRLRLAGWAVAHEQYRVMTVRQLPGTMLGGGALTNEDFTEMVGGDMHVTLNWSIVESLLAADGPVVSRLNEPVPMAVVDELSEKLPAFREAYHEGSLTVPRFRDYGPLILFRDMFIAGYQRLVDAVQARR